jgi:hypothetical protein
VTEEVTREKTKHAYTGQGTLDLGSAHGTFLSVNVAVALPLPSQWC